MIFAGAGSTSVLPTSLPIPCAALLQFAARAGSIEEFLTDRYYLYVLNERGRLYRAEIHHPPWPLQPAEARFERNTMTAPAGIELPDQPPLLHYAARQDVVIWPLHRLG